MNKVEITTLAQLAVKHDYKCSTSNFYQSGIGGSFRDWKAFPLSHY